MVTHKFSSSCQSMRAHSPLLNIFSLISWYFFLNLRSSFVEFCMQDVNRKLQRHDCREPHYSCSVSARQEKKAEFGFDRCLNLRGGLSCQSRISTWCKNYVQMVGRVVKKTPHWQSIQSASSWFPLVIYSILHEDQSEIFYCLWLWEESL